MKTLIIPGYRGSENGHWQRQWLAEDEAARLVKQDDWENPVSLAMASCAGGSPCRNSWRDPGCSQPGMRTGLPPGQPSVGGACRWRLAGCTCRCGADGRAGFRSFAALPHCRATTSASHRSSPRAADDPYMSFNKARSLSRRLGLRLCRYEVCRAYQHREWIWLVAGSALSSLIQCAGRRRPCARSVQREFLLGSLRA